MATRAIVSHNNDSVQYERESDYFYLQALSLIKQEKYDAAYDLLEHCRTVQPSSSSVLFELVNMYQFLGQRDKALKILRGIVENNPDNYQFWQSLVYFFENEGNKEAALKVYEEIARAFPEKSEIYMTLAAQYATSGNFNASIKAIEEYERKEGKSETSSLSKYQIYTYMRDKEAALAVLDTLLADNPDDVRLRSLLAETYYMFGDTERAIDIYQNVLSASPDDLLSLAAMAEYYKTVNNDSMYVAYTERLLVNEDLQSDNRKQQLRELVQYKDGQGDDTYIMSLFSKLIDIPHCFSDASEMFFPYIQYNPQPEAVVRPLIEKILALEPENRFGHLMLLIYAVEHENYDEIISRSDIALMYHPEVLGFYYYRGLSCLNLGRIDDAVATFLKGLEKCDETASTEHVSDIYTLLGDTYHNKGNIESAMCAYDSALVYNGSNLVALNNYAYYLALEGRDLNRALEMSARTLLEEPDEPIYIDTYAWILFLLGRYEEAKEYADKLLLREGEKSAVEFHHCGDIYAQNGDIDKAVECWTIARDKGDDSKKLKKKIKKRKYIPYDKK